MKNASTLNSLLALGLEKSLNYTLSLDPESQENLAKFENKTLCIHFQPMNHAYLIEVTNHRLKVKNVQDQPSDCHLEGNVSDLITLFIKKDSRLLFSMPIKVQGDTQLLEDFYTLMSQLDLDWEAQLSKLTGDVFAHEISHFFKKAVGWTQKSVSTLTQTMNEYLHEEIRLVPTDAELNRFYQQVDRLTLDSDRLDAKVTRLLQKSLNEKK